MDEKERDQLLQEAREDAQAGRLQQAGDKAERILQLFPDEVAALDVLGFVKYFQNDFVTGEQLCRRALEIAPEHAFAYKGLGLHLAKQGKLEKGIAALRKAIQVNPAFFDPYWDLAVTLYENQRYQEALDILNAAKEKFPAARSEITSFEQSVQAMLS